MSSSIVKRHFVAGRNPRRRRGTADSLGTVRPMSLYAGLSGWAYPEWRSAFYPARLPTPRMLGFYAQAFTTVEVNSTFYGIPKLNAIAGWCEQVPPTFRFAFKAHRAITHRRRFADTTDFLERFAEPIQGVGHRLGPVLFQFETIADVSQLAEFLGRVKGYFPRVVAEFRHPSWLTEATYDVLRAGGVAMCQTETDEGCGPGVPATGFSYLRLRRSDYTAVDLENRLRALQKLSAPEHDVFVYLKHDAVNAVLLRDAGIALLPAP
jgi:uncharacterized protein YecE (DUF72 family)